MSKAVKNVDQLKELVLENRIIIMHEVANTMEFDSGQLGAF
jgi:hypothetical protein